MSDEFIARLNAEHAIDAAVSFLGGPGGLPVAELHHEMGCATVSLMGAHVMDYTPRNAEPVVWLSELTPLEQGSPLRGGIPVCWPRFADQEQDGNVPFHGFLRSRTWSVAETEVAHGGEVRVRLETADDQGTRAIWPHPFRARLSVCLGDRLTVELAVQNPGEEAWSCTGALHTYFHVGDVERVAVHGLDGCRYQDKNDGFRVKTQRGPATVEAPVDRIYMDTEADCVIDDPVLERRIRIGKRGSRTTVVWNPWREAARAMPDFPNDAWRRMVCVETANAAGDVVTVPPGGKHALTTVIGLG